METIDTQSPKNKLTARQQEIFEFIRERTQVSKMPPTVREIGDRFNISSTNGVRSILAALIKKGYILAAIADEHDFSEAYIIHDHPFYVVTLYHPEYISRPNRHHPLSSTL